MAGWHKEQYVWRGHGFSKNGNGCCAIHDLTPCHISQKYFITEDASEYMGGAKIELRVFLLFTVAVLFFYWMGCATGGHSPVFIPPDVPPTVNLSTDKTSGYSPLSITFTLGYTDPRGTQGSYSLDYGDSTEKATGKINSGATTQVQHVYTCLLDTCNYLAGLTVWTSYDIQESTNVAINLKLGSGTKTVLNKVRNSLDNHF